MAGNILIFAGAGASTAVSSEKFPTTVEFFNRLPKVVQSNALFTSISNVLKRRKKPSGKVDIEEVLWELQQLSEFCRLTIEPDTVVHHLTEGANLAGIIGASNQNFGHMRSLNTKLKQRISELTDTINEVVYDLYADDPSPEELSLTWVPLIENILERGSKFEIYTTNYDLVLENTFDTILRGSKHAGRHLTSGWKGNIRRTLDMTIWRDSKTSVEYDGLLTKLHGSLDWSVRGEEVVVGDTAFKGDHEKHLIIYPGYKSRPEPGIFSDFHSHFMRSMDECDGAIFIGFAFRDEYINSLCERHIRQDTPVVIINPEANLSYPFETKNLKVIEAGFNSVSGEKALDHIYRGSRIRK